MQLIKVVLHPIKNLQWDQQSHVFSNHAAIENVRKKIKQVNKLSIVRGILENKIMQRWPQDRVRQNLCRKLSVTRLDGLTFPTELEKTGLISVYMILKSLKYPIMTSINKVQIRKWEANQNKDVFRLLIACNCVTIAIFVTQMRGFTSIVSFTIFSFLTRHPSPISFFLLISFTLLRTPWNN